MLRFGGLGGGEDGLPGADGGGREKQDAEQCAHALREDTVGQHTCFVSPAAAAVHRDGRRAQRRIVYADFTATGRALGCIERFIADRVLPLHGNTHTVATATARQSTYFRNEAREVISTYFNCTHEDAVIFTGSGATGALDKFVGMLVKSGGFNVDLAESDAPSNEQQQVQRYFSEDRWQSCQCTLCGVRVKSESGFRAHVWSPLHQERLRAKKPRAAGAGSGRRRLVVMVDPVAHHSTLLPFRELAKQFPIKKGGRAVFPERSSHRVLPDPPSLAPKEPWDLLEVETLELHADVSGGCAACSLDDLEAALSAARSFAHSSATNDSVLPVVVLAATSNVTGCSLDVYAVNELVHKYGGVACWDVAAMAAHKQLDFKYVFVFVFVFGTRLQHGAGAVLSATACCSCDSARTLSYRPRHSLSPPLPAAPCIDKVRQQTLRLFRPTNCSAAPAVRVSSWCVPRPDAPLCLRKASLLFEKRAARRETAALW